MAFAVGLMVVLMVITVVMIVSFAVLMPVSRLLAGRRQPATAGPGATAGR